MQITEQRITELLVNEAFTLLAEEAKLSTTNHPRWGLGWKALGIALHKQATKENILEEDALKALRRASMLLPNDIEVYKTLGKLAQVEKNNKQAQAYFQHVIKLDPTDTATLNALGLMNYENEDFDIAIEYFEQAVTTNTACFTSHINLAKAYKENNQPKKFRVSLLKANKITPSTEDEWVELVTLWTDSEFIKEGELLLNNFIKRFPKNKYIPYLKGIALARFGHYLEALDFFKEADILLPNNEKNIIRLAALTKEQDLSQALTILEEALEHNPSSPEFLYWISKFLFDADRFEEARDYIRRLIEVRFDAKTYSLAGDYFYGIFDFHKAADAFEKSLELKKEPCSFIYKYASTLIKTSQNIKAIKFIKENLKKDKKIEDNLKSLLSVAFYNIGKNEEAINIVKKTMNLKPYKSKDFSNYFFYLTHSDKHTLKQLFTEHLRFYKCFEVPIKNIVPHKNNNNPDRKINIGFVSGDMHNHAVAYYAIQIFKNINKNQFKLNVFYNDKREDTTTQELKKLVDYWFNITELSDIELVNLIRTEAIDILIDLSGHTANNRLPAFAYKPAPIQITYIGYPYTTGLKSMDYTFISSLMDDIEYQQQYWTEKFIIIPEKPKNVRPIRVSNTSEPPVELAATRNGFFTYASLNRFSKVNIDALNAWVIILNNTSNTKLLLGNVEKEQEQEIINFFDQQGITAERLILIPRVSVEGYMQLFNKIDLILDTWPYGGATTTNNALSMGVPVLSIVGHHPVQALLNTIQRSLDLEQFLVKDVATYVDQAIAWSTNLEELQACRTEILNRPEQTAEVLSEGTFNLALRMAWQRWCAGLPAASFHLPEKN